jgi:hypothetical protein
MYVFSVGEHKTKDQHMGFSYCPLYVTVPFLVAQGQIFPNYFPEDLTMLLRWAFW